MPQSTPLQPPATAVELRTQFEAVESFTVGIEEEVMLLDPLTLDLAPVAGAVLEQLGGDPRFKRELPAAQLEIATNPVASAPEAVAQLQAARARLVAAAAGIARPAAAGAHPFSAPAGELSTGERYDSLSAEYGPIGRRQLIAALQVHVAVGGAERTLAVYNALRSYLPELAALAANAAFYDGESAGLASVRPTIAGMLPRQGVPPVLESWDAFAEELRWGAAAGVPVPRVWWWELRPHPEFGTLEVRVPDAQTTLADAAGVVAVAQAIVAWLAERWDAGERLPVVPSWRIEENRFFALRHGVEGELADLDSGARVPTRERLRWLLDELAPVAARLGADALLVHAHDLVDRNGAMRQREVAAERGVRGLVAWQAARYGDPLPERDRAHTLAGDAARVPKAP